MLQAVRGDPRAFSKLTAHSFLEKGVKNKQISKRKKAGSLLAACGGVCNGPGRGKESVRGGIWAGSPCTSPSQPCTCSASLRVSMETPVRSRGTQRGILSTGSPGEGASTPATAAPHKPSPRKAAARNAQRALGTARAGTRGAVSPQNPPAGAGSLTSTTLRHVPGTKHGGLAPHQPRAPRRWQTLSQGADQRRLQGTKPGATRSKSAPARGHGEGKDPVALPAARCTCTA